MSSFFKSRACSSTQWMSKTVKTCQNQLHSARNWPRISKICIHPHYEVHGVQAGLHQKSCFVLQLPSMTMILVSHFFVFLCFFGSSAWIARGCKSASFRCSCSLQGLSCHDVPAAVNFLATPKQFFWDKAHSSPSRLHDDWRLHRLQVVQGQIVLKEGLVVQEKPGSLGYLFNTTDAKGALILSSKPWSHPSRKVHKTPDGRS